MIRKPRAPETRTPAKIAGVRDREGALSDRAGVIEEQSDMLALGDIDATEEHGSLLRCQDEGEATSGFYETLSLVGDTPLAGNLLIRDRS